MLHNTTDFVKYVSKIIFEIMSMIQLVYAHLVIMKIYARNS
jgi:hypothetical protein